MILMSQMKVKLPQGVDMLIAKSCKIEKIPKLKLHCKPLLEDFHGDTYI